MAGTHELQVTDLIDRPATVDDAATLAGLFNAVEVAAGGHPYTTEAEQRDLLSGWIAEPERNTRVLVAPDGTAVAYAGLVVPPPGGPRADLPGAVLPEWRGRGIGRRLMDWQLDRARNAYAEAAPDLEWQLQSGTLPGDRSAVRLLERFGFTPVRYFFDMQAPVGPGHESELPDGLTMRAYTPDLADAVYATHITAFRDHWGFQQREQAQWTGMTVGSSSFRADLCRLVFDGDRLVAYLLSYDSHPGELYIGQVGTLREYRRRGLASVMLGDVLAAAERSAFSQVHLGVDADSPTGAVGVYERVGFTVRSRFVAYEKKLGVV